MTPKFIVVTLLLASTATFLGMRSNVDQVPPSLPLSQLPQQIGAWKSRDIALDPAVLQILGDGRFLNRLYMESSSAGPTQIPAGPIGLFIGYFPTQRTGQAIHSPQNCLPGAGWTFLSEHPITLTDEDGKNYDIGEYVITDGNIKQEVLYWYRAHGRSISSEYRAKFYMIADAMRYNRTDGALIRIITPMQPGETQQQVHDRAISFAKKLAPMLPAYIPD
ncbi:MAG: EpsI family protein [Acidobacteria bacterium]|nr:EpsI family protein [Acidobacteriota bacterium]